MTQEEQTRVGVGVFIFRSRTDLRFVLGKRKGSLGAGGYSLAGGHLEFGESFEECARRETREETGLELEDVRFLTAVETSFPAEQKHYVTVFITGFAAEGAEAQLLEPDKCEAWEWWTMEQMWKLGSEDEEELFAPLRTLLRERREVCGALEKGRIPQLS